MTTRDEIILELKGYGNKSKEEKKALMKEFLEDVGENSEDVEKILNDLESYVEY